MIYQYECKNCSRLEDVIKPVSGIDNVETCKGCDGVMSRFISPGFLNISSLEPHFNHGLGREIRNKRDIKNAIREIKSETGKDIVEVGNDKMDSIKKVRKEY